MQIKEKIILRFNISKIEFASSLRTSEQWGNEYTHSTVNAICILIQIKLGQVFSEIKEKNPI